MVFKSGLSGYASMFMPIIAAFPFIIPFCSERTSGLMRFTITRTGKYRYYFSKFFTAFLCGGFAVMLGLLIYGLAVRIIFIPLNEYEISAGDMDWIFTNGKSELYMVCQIFLSAFLYGAVSAMPAFFLSSICKNPYLITCIPFMIAYMQQTAVQKFISNAIVAEKYDIANRLNDFFPNSILNLPYYTTWHDVKYIVIFNVIIIFAAFIGFIILMNLRQDKGA
jgi:hypothetical protein